MNRKKLLAEAQKFLNEEQKAITDVASGHRIGYNLHKNGVSYYAMDGNLYQVFDNHTRNGTFMASMLEVLQNRSKYPEIAFVVGIQRMRELSTKFNR